MSKRFFDLAVAIPALILCTPIFTIAALLVKLSGPGPVFFRQPRVGLRNQKFTMMKFRTMVVNDDDRALREIIELELAGEREPAADGSYKLEHDPREPAASGDGCAATSIDELPQLLNVVRGEMSIVGPRPALDWEVELFPAEFRRRTDVPPGITGLWQVSGRSQLTTPDMLRLDLEYVDNASLVMDVRILVGTIPTLVRGDGAQ